MGNVEMKCAYHPGNYANARCGACQRPLCPACDHRIKGYPYCQDCIVAGIETLRRNAGSGHRIHHQEGKSVFLASLLGLIPGLGAAYNGQNVKALMHFVTVLGLWTLTDIFGLPLEVAFGLGAVAFHLYSIYDAFRSAKAARRGEDLTEEDERLKLFVQRRMNLLGGLLVSIGALAMLDFFFPHLLNRFWPMVLIFAGAYFIWSFHRRHDEPQVKTVYRTPPPSVIPPNFDSSASDFARNQYRER